MKFLVYGLPDSTPIPREQGAELLKATLDWIKTNLANGTIDSTFNLIGGGGVGIVNASTHDEILTVLLDCPIYPFFNWEITPLLDYESAYEAYISFYERLAG